MNAGPNYPTGTAFQWKLDSVRTNISTANNHNLYSGLAPGYHKVCLFIYTYTGSGNFNLCDSLCQYVNVTNTNPCANLSAGWTFVIQPNNSVKFSPVVNPVAAVHGWNFGDGTTSGDLAPVHGYAAAGLYRVCHYVYLPGTNCKDSSCAMIQVNAPTPCIGFGVTIQDIPDNNGSTGHYLKANVTGPNATGVTYIWSDNASTQSIHVQAGGQYCVTVSSANNCSASVCINITINPNPCGNLDAAWTQTYTSTGCLSFKPITTATNLKHLWTFGDGTSSTNFDPVHCYAASGLFNVCHIVSIPGANCADTVCRSIQANGNSTCHADYTYQSAGSGSASIYFIDASASNDSIVSWSWNFGDGSPVINQQNAGHQFPATNTTYYVCHTIKTLHGCTNTKCDSVKVGVPNTNNCHASFLWESLNCLNVRFKNTSTGTFNQVKWTFGDGTTDTTLNPVHTFTNSGVYTVLLEISGPYCQQSIYMTITPPTCANNDTICGVVFEDLNNNGVLDNGEHGLMGVSVYVDNAALTTDSSGRYHVILPPGPHNIKAVTPTGCISTMPLATNNGGSTANYYGYHVNGTGGTYCGYNFGINCNIVHICGIVFFDANNNGVKDAGEAGMAHIRVTLKNSNGREWFTFTNQNGEYCITLPADNYSIKIISPDPNTTITPASINLDATVAGQNYGYNDFAVYRTPGVCDLKVELIAHSCISPGFPTYYSVQVSNTGTQPAGGQVHLFYDPAVSLDYTAPVAASHNSSTRTITWNLPNINPGQFTNLWATFKAITPLQIGQFVFTLADVNPNCSDINFVNNIDTVQQLVRTSWDPNNKLVNPIGKGPQGLINNGETLTYTINFQNTGNTPTVNVILRDLFTNELDISSMEMLASSHPFTFQMEGNEGVWKFSGIMLPDSGTNQTASHGFVMFSMKAKAALPEGTEIFNHADIYFDYNESVITESTLNTIDYKTSVEELAANNVNITLMPNPFREFTTIKIEGADAPYEIKVYDLLGNLVNRQIAEQNIFTIRRGTLVSGVYLYEVVKQNQVIGKGKMIAAE
ncbi:MAG: T9SS type A sorting domain-containing protein [Bacteroidetes bacterium]|nr:T9SS type A sorting domain-containing protein [Bacteroidota bacterium]